MLTSARSRRRCRCLAVVACAYALAVPAAAGTTTVYKCFDRSLNVLYTDQPCTGELLEIRAGDPDAAALAALQKERDALAQSIAQRIADSRRPREVVTETAYVPPPAAPPAYAANEVWYPAWNVNPPYPQPRRNRDGAARDERRERVGYVPSPLPPRTPPQR